jgi:hypothetical protein
VLDRAKNLADQGMAVVHRRLEKMLATGEDGTSEAETIKPHEMVALLRESVAVARLSVGLGGNGDPPPREKDADLSGLSEERLAQLEEILQEVER